MRVYCIIKNCNIEKIKDFASFRSVLPLYIETIADKETAIEEAKKLAQKPRKLTATEKAKKLAQKTCESYVVVLDLNARLSAALIAVRYMNSDRTESYKHSTSMLEKIVDNWKIIKLSKNDTTSDWAIQKIKTKYDFKEPQSKSFFERNKMAAIVLGATLATGFILNFGILSILISATVGTIATRLIENKREQEINNHYHCARKIRAIKKTSEQQAIKLGKEAINWKNYVASFIKPVAWQHPLAFAAGMKHACNDNKKMIDAIESLRPCAPSSWFCRTLDKKRKK